MHGTPVVDDSFAGAPTVSADLLPRIQAVPGVAEAGGNLVDLSGTGNIAKILDSDGTVIAGNMPSFGFGIDPSHPRFNPLTLAEGAWAAGPDQVVLDQATAKDHGFAVGDTVRIAAEGPARSFTVTGLARFGGVDCLGGATMAVFDVPTARTMLGKTGFHAIQVAADPGRLPGRARGPHRAPPAGDGARSRPATSRPRPTRPGHLRGHRLHPRHPARLRRHRPLRGRLRHLQHPVASRSPSAPVSWRRCAPSAPRAARCCAP